jgi:hypothetical protein
VPGAFRLSGVRDGGSGCGGAVRSLPLVVALDDDCSRSSELSTEKAAVEVARKYPSIIVSFHTPLRPFPTFLLPPTQLSFDVSIQAQDLILHIEKLAI